LKKTGKGKAMNEQQLLKATGNAWKVLIYKGGNRRRLLRVPFVRASDREKAERVALEITPEGNAATAFAWDPRNDGKLTSKNFSEIFEKK